MKKLITLLLCVTMVMSMLVVPAGATGNYNEQTGAVAVTEYPNGDSFDTLVSNATDSSTLYSYEGGIAGKAADDYSQVIRLSGDTSSTTDFDISTTGTSANAYLNWYGGKSGTYIHDGRAFEFDAYVDGDVKLMIQTTATNVTYDITESACQGEWKHYTLWLDASGSYIYENGVLVAQYTTKKTVYRIRLVIWLTANKVDFDGVVAIDNMKITTGLASCPEYTEASVSSTNDAVKLYDNMINVPADMTVEALKGSLTSDIALGYNVCTSDLSPKADDAIVNIGDVIVAYDSTYANNTNMKYIDVVDSDTINEAIEAANLIKYVDYENNETLTIGNGASLASLTYTPGLYGKAADDDALVLVPNGAPTPRLGISGIDVLNTSSSLCVADDFEAETVTAEFSVAINNAYGDFNISIISQYKPNDVTGWEYVNTYRMNNEIFKVVDGKINASYLTPGYIYDFPAEQWLRVAITIKPETEKYDLYINGILARQDGPLGGDSNTNFISAAAEDWDGTTEDKWQYVGLNELRIMGYTTSGETSEIAVDDLKVYYGEYNSNDKITVSGYTVDSDNVLVMDDGVTLTKAMVESAVNEGCTVAEYGNGFVVSNGFVKRYFTGAAKSITVNNDDIKLYDANGELTEIAAGSRIYAQATPEYVGYRPVLILAVYEGDELLTIRLATGLGSDFKTGIYQVADDADVANLSVKAMLWDGFENIKPYVEAIAVPAN